MSVGEAQKRIERACRRRALGGITAFPTLEGPAKRIGRQVVSFDVDGRRKLRIVA